MFDKKYDDRLRLWVELRQSLSNEEDPIQKVIDYYNRVPLVSIQVDPYDQSAWLDPWTLLKENNYCEFAKLLGICYTLQLSECFIDSAFEIHICTDAEESKLRYLLFVDDKVIGYNGNEWIFKKDLPANLYYQKSYTMPNLY